MHKYQKYNFKIIEKDSQEHSNNNNVYRWQEDQSVNKNNNYIIDSPPPTISGSLHMGHVFSYCHMDFIARFQRIEGKNVFFPMGFDDNGLPTERLVEKNKKIKARNLSREEFIDICSEVSKDYRTKYRSLFNNISLSVDWTQEYHTINKNCTMISQQSFIDLYNKGFIYKELKPMIWDTVDQTAISQAEIEEIKEVKKMCYLRFEREEKGIDISGKEVQISDKNIHSSNSLKDFNNALQFTVKLFFEKIQSNKNISFNQIKDSLDESQDKNLKIIDNILIEEELQDGSKKEGILNFWCRKKIMNNNDNHYIFQDNQHSVPKDLFHIIYGKSNLIEIHEHGIIKEEWIFNIVKFYNNLCIISKEIFNYYSSIPIIVLSEVLSSLLYKNTDHTENNKLADISIETLIQHISSIKQYDKNNLIAIIENLISKYTHQSIVENSYIIIKDINNKLGNLYSAIDVTNISEYLISLEEILFFDDIKIISIFLLGRINLGEYYDRNIVKDKASNIGINNIRDNNTLLFNNKQKKILVGTTRPEMLPSCCAVLFNPKDKRFNTLPDFKKSMQYAGYLDNNGNQTLDNEILKKAEKGLIAEEKGGWYKDGFKKETGYLYRPISGVCVPLIPDEDVKLEKGSGLVMCCTFGDQQDVVWWRRHHMPSNRIIVNKYGKINGEHISKMLIGGSPYCRAEILETGKHLTNRILEYRGVYTAFINNINHSNTKIEKIFNLINDLFIDSDEINKQISELIHNKTQNNINNYNSTRFIEIIKDKLIKNSDQSLEDLELLHKTTVTKVLLKENADNIKQNIHTMINSNSNTVKKININNNIQYATKDSLTYTVTLTNKEYAYILIKIINKYFGDTLKFTVPDIELDENSIKKKLLNFYYTLQYEENKNSSPVHIRRKVILDIKEKQNHELQILFAYLFENYYFARYLRVNMLPHLFND